MRRFVDTRRFCTARASRRLQGGEALPADNAGDERSLKPEDLRIRPDHHIMYHLASRRVLYRR